MRGALRVVSATGMGVALLAGAVAEPESTGTLYVTAGEVHTGTGEVFAPGAVAIVDGKVTKVGSPDAVSVPPGARVIEGGPATTVIPGLVAASSEHLGKGGDDPASVSPDIRALDGYDFLADETGALAAGITTVFLSPGSVRVVSGRGAVVKTAGETPEHRTLRADAGLVTGIGAGVNRPPNRIDPPDLPDATGNPLLPHRRQLPVTRSGSLMLLRDIVAPRLEGPHAVGYTKDPCRVPSDRRQGAPW